MRRKADYPLQKVTLNLFEGDWDFLQATYPRIGASRVIRDLVRAHVNKVKKAQGPRPLVDIDVGEA